MGYAVGRLIDHVDILVRDLAAARRFYGAILAALGREAAPAEDGLACDELYVGPVQDGDEPTHVHLCFQAPDRATVERFHAAGLQAGGRDNGPPGLRGYHPGYYAAFLLDPEGNNIEAKVDERVTARSAAAITIETG